ncbi:hypothetical protein FACS1894190_11450 [Spirochaetia bacterium]|nr:hypothetical protein FACS1894190_11450 [Spirochaetia bacterium]GHV19490.1 hypothetical protein FACS189494_01240 [Spirochaetia bacterium]
MLLTVQGFFEEGKFIPSEPVKIPEHKRAIVTILDENEDDRKKRQMTDLAECYRLLDESMDEEVPDFPRANLHRKVENWIC